MINKQIFFCIIIILWLFIGVLGGLHAKENRVNYEMLFFMSFAPFIPLIAKFCNLL